MLGNYKIRVNNEAESKEAHELFCVLGGSEHICDKFGIVCLSGGKVYTDRVEFFEDYDDCEELTLPQLRDLVTKSKKEQGLISGADALRALADGKDVEYFTDKWVCCDSKQLVVSWYLDDVYQFRIKPSTVKIEIKIPAPFEPKVGDYVYFLCSDETKGYAETTLEDTPMNWGFVQFGAWRTEKEVKQVVAALRSALTSK